MASRFWVGGNGNWDASTTTNWSATSGGSGGASVPTASDDVTFDSLSSASNAAYTVSFATFFTVHCNNLTVNGPGAGNSVTLSGSAIINVSASLSFSGTDVIFVQTAEFAFVSTSPGNTITTNGLSSIAQFVFSGVGGGWSLQDDLLIPGGIVISNGTFSTNDHTITSAIFNSTGTSTRVVNLGSSTIIINSLTSTGFSFTSTGLTLNPGTSTLVLNNSSGAKSFAGGGNTFNNLFITGGSGSPIYTISGSNTFNNITVGAGSTTLKFTAGTTQTCSSFNAVGSLGSLITLESTANGSPWTLSVPSGVVACEYISLRDSTATGGAQFYIGDNSTNVSGNTGWNLYAYIESLLSPVIHQGVRIVGP